eukprot:6205020-Pleurochrysis_carterae.AAC.3
MAFIIETPLSRRSSTRLHHTRKRVHLEARRKQRQQRSPTACADERTGRVCGGRVATLNSTARSCQEVRSNIDERTQCRQKQIVCRLASRPAGFKHGARLHAESARVAAEVER